MSLDNRFQGLAVTNTTAPAIYFEVAFKQYRNAKGVFRSRRGNTTENIRNLLLSHKIQELAGMHTYVTDKHFQFCSLYLIPGNSP